ncbi:MULTISPECIES: Lacal_2735 family protein [unclassified Aureispira]|uniref:Lacal_2735 family protein n=1 Tax=unclassified Aureispira TaxID=2649989 RepID=UPI0006975934|nr:MULTISPECIES: Lacal_2735 family protein [unclassified Aureispira]WMX13056.1 Lacal_2735 family protein [Aureispira sp. CCB-E]
MFGWFKKKTKKEILEAKYKKLMEESFRLSHIDRAASTQKNAEAEKVLEEIEQLKD